MASAATHTNGKGQTAPAGKSGRTGQAPGGRLAEAFEAVECFPVLLESRERVMREATSVSVSKSELSEAIESDVALTIAVLRLANRDGAVGEVATVPEAVETLRPSGVLALAGTAPVFDFFESNGGWELKPERFRTHALAARRVADRISRISNGFGRDELTVAAMLHDVGRLVVSRLHPGYKAYFDAAANTPEQRLRDERDELGIDHALVGGVLARRWNLPQRIAVAIERHHSPDAEGLGAAVAVADMVAHYVQGEAVTPDRLTAMAERCDIDRAALRGLLYEFPYAQQEVVRASEPCPLSAREMDVLRLLAEGKVYKQIAAEMQLSVSTIRTHLHNIYGKIGAVDRAQAVLTAHDRGWL